MCVRVIVTVCRQVRDGYKPKESQSPEAVVPVQSCPELLHGSDNIPKVVQVSSDPVHVLAPAPGKQRFPAILPVIVVPASATACTEK